VDLDINAALGSDSGGTATTTDSIKVGIGSGDSFQEGQASSELVSTSATNAQWSIGVVVVGTNNLAVTDEYTVNFTSSCTTSGLSTLRNIDSALSSEVGTVPRMGSGLGDEFVEGTLAADSTEMSAGGSETISVVLVDGNGDAVSNLPTGSSVTFSSNCVSSDLASFSPSETVDIVGGRASVVYRAEGCSGLDTVNAEYVYVQSGSTVLRANVELNIAVDNVLGLFLSSSPIPPVVPSWRRAQKVMFPTTTAMFPRWCKVVLLTQR